MSHIWLLFLLFSKPNVCQSPANVFWRFHSNLLSFNKKMGLYTISFSSLAIQYTTSFPFGKVVNRRSREKQKLRAGTWQTLDLENRRDSKLLSFVQDDICLLFHMLYIFYALTQKLSRNKPAWRQPVLLPSAGQSTSGWRIRGRRQQWRWRRFCAWPIPRERLAASRTHSL